MKLNNLMEEYYATLLSPYEGKYGTNSTIKPFNFLL
jgi:hypothetical protein